jgi:hypothetical protein
MISHLPGLYGAQIGGLVITSMNCIVPASLTLLSKIFEIHEQQQQGRSSSGSSGGRNSSGSSNSISSSSKVRIIVQFY